MSLKEQSGYDRFISRLKSRPIVIILLVIFIVVTGLATFTDSLERLFKQAWSLFVFNKHEDLTQGLTREKKSANILEPTWIPVLSAVEIFDGKGLLSIPQIPEDGNGHPVYAWINLSLEGAAWAPGHTGQLMLYGGQRKEFYYQEQRYAVNVLALSLTQAFCSVTFLGPVNADK